MSSNISLKSELVSISAGGGQWPPPAEQIKSEPAQSLLFPAITSKVKRSFYTTSNIVIMPCMNTSRYIIDRFTAESAVSRFYRNTCAACLFAHAYICTHYCSYIFFVCSRLYCYLHEISLMRRASVCYIYVGRYLQIGS